jgi:hypothetical protein
MKLNIVRQCLRFLCLVEEKKENVCFCLYFNENGTHNEARLGKWMMRIFLNRRVINICIHYTERSIMKQSVGVVVVCCG